MNIVERHRNPNRPAASEPVARRTAARGTAERRAAHPEAAAGSAPPLMPPLAIAATMTSVILIAGVRADALVLSWLACVLWTLAVGVAHAVDRAVGRRNGSACSQETSLHERRSREEDHDFALKVGQFAYRRNRERLEALYDDAHLFSQTADPCKPF